VTKSPLQSAGGKFGSASRDMAHLQYQPEKHEPCRSEPHSGQQEMSRPDGFSFMADREMVPLLTALNGAGIQTYSHCAGHESGQCAWVVLELEGLELEVRPPVDDAGSGSPRGAQLLLRWSPSWLSQ